MPLKKIRVMLGVRIGLFDLLKLCVKYDPDGQVAGIARRMAQDLDPKKTLDEVLSGGIPSITKMTSEMSDVIDGVMYNLQRDENQTFKVCDWSLTFAVFQHDQGDFEYMFALGRELMSVNIPDADLLNLNRSEHRSTIRDLRQVLCTFGRTYVGGRSWWDLMDEMKTYIHIPNIDVESSFDVQIVQDACSCCS